MSRKKNSRCEEPHCGNHQKRRKQKSFDPTFSIGEIKDFSMEFRYAELPTVGRDPRDSVPDRLISRDHFVKRRSKHPGLPKKFLFRVFFLLAKGEKSTYKQSGEKQDCRIREISPGRGSPFSYIIQFERYLPALSHLYQSVSR